MGGLGSCTTNMLRRIAAPLCAAGIALAFTSAPAAAGRRTVSRVLITGGQIDAVTKATATTEVWDSTTGTFAASSPLLQTRKFHTASLLTAGATAGDLLIAGGDDDTNTPLANAEVYSPTSGSAGLISLNAARVYHTATVLSDGRVLITGGTSMSGGSPTVLQSAEIYDPASAGFSLVTCSNGASTDCMATPRSGHTATLLSNGQVLISGGAAGINDTAITASAEIFDPATNVFTPLSGTMSDGREFDAAILLNNGTVLIAGGITPVFPGGTVTADIFDPSTSAFTQVNSSLSVARVGMTAATLGNGSVMMAGGTSSPAVDLFTDSTNLFSVSRGSLHAARRYGTATALRDGTVLLAGGGNSTAEIANSRGTRFTLTGSMSVSREGHTATLLP